VVVVVVVVGVVVLKEGMIATVQMVCLFFYEIRFLFLSILEELDVDVVIK
jgi:hypothetical protein